MRDIKQSIATVWLNVSMESRSEDENMGNSNDYDVIIIGGGATGAGIARDCALRGLRVVLLERHDIATGHRPQSRFIAQRCALRSDR
jgi:glycerol-3-phosphate dehydrogenase